MTAVLAGQPLALQYVLCAGSASQESRQVQVSHMSGLAICQKGKRQHQNLVQSYAVAHLPVVLWLFQVYAISSQAKDIRSVVTELNMRRADIDSAPVRLRAKAQPLPSAETDRRWSDFVTEVHVSFWSDLCRHG